MIKKTIEFYGIKDNSSLTRVLEIKLKLKHKAVIKIITINDCETFKQG